MKSSREKFLKRIGQAEFLKKFTPLICCVIIVTFCICLFVSKSGVDIPIYLVLFISFSVVLGIPTTVIAYFCVVPKVNNMLKILKESNISNDMVISELESAVFLDQSREYGYTDHLLIIKSSIVLPIKNISLIKCMHGVFETRFIVSTKNINCKEITIRTLHGFYAYNDANDVYRLVERVNKEHSIFIKYVCKEIDYSD